MKPLYEITNEYLSLLNEFYESDDITDEQMELLDRIKGDLKDKITNVAAFIKNLEVEHCAIENAIDAMVARSSGIIKKIQRLREYLLINMKSCDINEVNSPFFKVKIKNNPPCVRVTDEKMLPNDYVSETVIHRIDKALLLRHLKNNVDIPGAVIEQKERIDIR